MSTFNDLDGGTVLDEKMDTPDERSDTSCSCVDDIALMVASDVHPSHRNSRSFAAVAKNARGTIVKRSLLLNRRTDTLGMC